MSDDKYLDAIGRLRERHPNDRDVLLVCDELELRLTQLALELSVHLLNSEHSIARIVRALKSPDRGEALPQRTATLVVNNKTKWPKR